MNRYRESEMVPFFYSYFWIIGHPETLNFKLEING